MLKTTKYYQTIANSLEFFDYGFSDDFRNTVFGIGKKLSLSELSEYAKQKIKDANLEIVDAEHAKMVCVVYAEYPDSEGYDIHGLSCFTGKKMNTKAISYCGFCGDVNNVYLTEKNSVRFYVR